MSTNIHKVMKQAQAFVQENLAECCADLRHFNHSGVIAPNSKLRELTNIVARSFHKSSLSVAEEIIHSAAVNHLAEG